MAKSKKKHLNNNFFRTFSIPLCAILFFLAVCWSASDTIKGMAVISVILVFVGGVSFFPRLRDRISIPFVPLALYVAMCGISTFYALSGKFALYEFLKLLVSFCFAIFMLAATPGEGASPGRKIASILEGCCAIASVVSIDLLSTRLISTPVLSILGSISSNYHPDVEGVVIDTRMTSIFTNPNVFATCSGICILLSLGLILSSEKKSERTGHVACLFLNSLAFVLGFSMGATAFIAIAFLIYLLLERKDRLGSLFILMIETLITVLITTVPIYLTSFTEWKGIQLIPLLCMVAGSVVLCPLDRFVGQPMGTKLSGHHKIVMGIIACSLAVFASFAVVAYHATGPVVVSKDIHNLQRSLDLEPGDYTLTVQASKPSNVHIAYQNKYHTMMLTSEILYLGPISEAKFTVPEDSITVHFYFLPEDTDVTIESVVCSGPETVSIPLGYKLLPGFIANRIQSLWASHSAIQRTVFFEDGIKLFHRNPVVGLGLGSFENAIRGVQTFSYETKYAHNHYIQLMAETGLVGLILFLFVLLCSLAAVLFERKKGVDAHPLTPALGAALVFMAGHAFMEVSFSYYAALPFILCTFILIILCCGSAIPLPRLNGTVKTSILGTCAALIAIFAVFLFQNISAAVVAETSSSMDGLIKAAEMDKFEYADYMLSYVVQSSNYPDDLVIQDTALGFVEELEKLNSNTVPYYLADFYFSHGQTEKAFSMIEKYLNYVASDSTAWNQAFNLLILHADLNDTFTAGLQRVVDIYTNWNENNIGTITLNEKSLKLLNLFQIELK